MINPNSKPLRTYTSRSCASKFKKIVDRSGSSGVSMAKMAMSGQDYTREVFQSG